MFFVRPITHADLPAVLGLSERTGTGLTTLPANQDRLRERIERALASFAGTADRADACYVFVLADGSDGRVAASARSRRRWALKEPWYNYHVGTLVPRVARPRRVHGGAHAVPRERPHRPHRALLAVPGPGYRRGKNGALLAKSRPLFIANSRSASRRRSSPSSRASSGRTASARSGKGSAGHFFAMEYSTADYLTGIGQKAFIAELMPKHPVYVNLLPVAAREAIGAVHVDTAPAARDARAGGLSATRATSTSSTPAPTVECFATTSTPCAARRCCR
jgi:arginine N-succinyltransferase